MDPSPDRLPAAVVGSRVGDPAHSVNKPPTTTQQIGKTTPVTLAQILKRSGGGLAAAEGLSQAPSTAASGYHIPSYKVHHAQQKTMGHGASCITGTNYLI